MDSMVFINGMERTLKLTLLHMKADLLGKYNAEIKDTVLIFLQVGRETHR